MTHLAATAVTTAATHLMRAGQWTAATDLLRATQPDDPAEHRALALARAEVAVDQDFAQQTDHAPAALTALTQLLHDSTDPTITWDAEMLHLRKAYGTELARVDQSCRGARRRIATAARGRSRTTRRCRRRIGRRDDDAGDVRSAVGGPPPRLWVGGRSASGRGA